MAEFINPIGKIRGKFGNVIPYVGKNGKNYCRSTSLERKAGGEGQKRQSWHSGRLQAEKDGSLRSSGWDFPAAMATPKASTGLQVPT